MILKRYAAIAAFAVSMAALSTTVPSLVSQTRESYKARLSALPADARTRATMAGSGAVTATLDGAKLAVSGSFDGLLSSATKAELHSAVAAGVRGPSIADLTIAKAAGGMITGTVDLTPPQVENLRHGGLYVQIQSEKIPDGVLWGWFLK